MAREAAAPGEELRPEGHVEAVDRDGGYPGDQEGGQDPAQTGGIPFTPSRERPKFSIRADGIGAKVDRFLADEVEAIMAKEGFRDRTISKTDEADKVAAALSAPLDGLTAKDIEKAMAGPQTYPPAHYEEPQKSEITQALEALSERVDILTQTAASVVLVATELAAIRDQLNGKGANDSISTTLFGTQVFQPAGAVLLCKRQELDQRMKQLADDLTSLQEAAAWADTAAMLPTPNMTDRIVANAITADKIRAGATPALGIPVDKLGLSDEHLKRMEVEIYGEPMPRAIASGEGQITGRVADNRHWLTKFFAPRK